MTIENLLTRLDKVKPKGTNQWQACCPAHGDNNPSLGIKLLNDGRILINCLAGCGAADVVFSIGLTMSDLFPKDCLGEFKGWERLKSEIKKQPPGNMTHSEWVLWLAKTQRKEGKRLSQSDMAIEQKAFLEVQRANSKR